MANEVKDVNGKVGSLQGKRGILKKIDGVRGVDGGCPHESLRKHANVTGSLAGRLMKVSKMETEVMRSEENGGVRRMCS